MIRWGLKYKPVRTRPSIVTSSEGRQTPPSELLKPTGVRAAVVVNDKVSGKSALQVRQMAAKAATPTSSSK